MAGGRESARAAARCVPCRWALPLLGLALLVAVAAGLWTGGCTAEAPRPGPAADHAVGVLARGSGGLPTAQCELRAAPEPSPFSQVTVAPGVPAPELLLVGLVTPFEVLASPADRPPASRAVSPPDHPPNLLAL